MVEISAFPSKVVEATWLLLADSSLLLLIGLLLAGLVHSLLTEKMQRRFLQREGTGSVIKATFLGIPLPLCSCSVLPVTQKLRQSGLSRGGTTAFLIATPETGVDSILLTYSLMDPLMTVARPISAALTAITAGILVERTSDSEAKETLVAAAQCRDACGCRFESNEATTDTAGRRFVKGIRYAFGDLIQDLAPYLLLGYLLAGLLAALLGNDFLNIPETFRQGWGGYAGAVVVGLPLYVCATSSTPLGAVLLAAGFSPGAILVFLLVGPATNLASLTVVARILERRHLLIYLAVIVISALLCGLALDSLYGLLNIQAVYQTGEHSHGHSWLETAAAALVTALILYYSVRKLVRKRG